MASRGEVMSRYKAAKELVLVESSYMLGEVEHKMVNMLISTRTITTIGVQHD